MRVVVKDDIKVIAIKLFDIYSISPESYFCIKGLIYLLLGKTKPEHAQSTTTTRNGQPA